MDITIGCQKSTSARFENQSIKNTGNVHPNLIHTGSLTKKII